MTLFFGRYIIIGRSLVLGRTSAGILCRNSQTSIRRMTTTWTSSGRSKTRIRVTGSPMSHAHENSVMGCEKWFHTGTSIHLSVGARARLSTTNSIVETFSKTFSTSSALQSSNQDGTLVYKGPMNTVIKLLKALSMTTSVVGCIIVPMVYMHSDVTAVNIIVTSMASLTVLTPFLLHWFTKGYVNHIYFDCDTDTYTSYTYTIFLQRKKLQFTPDDVEIPAIRNVFTSFVAKGVPLLTDDASFFNQNDVYHLKGFDKQVEHLSMEQLKSIYGSDDNVEKTKEQ